MLALLVGAMGLALTFFVHGLSVAKNQGKIEERVANQAARQVEDRDEAKKAIAEHRRDVDAKLAATDQHHDKQVEKLEGKIDRVEIEIRVAIEKAVTDVRGIAAETNARVDRLSERFPRREE